MTRDDLHKLIEDEVSKLMREPVREPQPPPLVQKQVMYEPTLKNEDEIDETLFGTREH